MKNRLTALAAMIAGVTALGMVPAHATDHHAPGSWTQRWSINHRGVLTHSTLPHCANEDGSGGPRPCTWNVGPGVDGNGYGLAYIVHRDMTARYVWPERPTGQGWHWVSDSWADALAEGTDADARRHWERCIIKLGDTTRIKCPGGYHTTS